MGGCCVTCASNTSDVYIPDDEDPKFSRSAACPFDTISTVNTVSTLQPLPSYRPPPSIINKPYYALYRKPGGPPTIVTTAGGAPAQRCPSPVFRSHSPMLPMSSRPLPASPRLAPMKTVQSSQQQQPLPRLPSPVPMLSSGRASPVVVPIAPAASRSCSPNPYPGPMFFSQQQQRISSPGPATPYFATGNLPTLASANAGPNPRFFTPQRPRHPYEPIVDGFPVALRSRSASPLPRQNRPTPHLLIRPAIIPQQQQQQQTNRPTAANQNPTMQHHQCNLPFHECLNSHQRQLASPEPREFPMGPRVFSPPGARNGPMDVPVDDLIIPAPTRRERQMSLSSASDPGEAGGHDAASQPPPPPSPVPPPPPPPPQPQSSTRRNSTGNRNVALYPPIIPVVGGGGGVVHSMPMHPDLVVGPGGVGVGVGGMDASHGHSLMATGAHSPRVPRQYHRAPCLPRRMDSPENSPRNADRFSNYGSFRKDASRSHLRREDSTMMLSVHQMQLQLSHVRRDDQLLPQVVQWNEN